MLLGNGDGTFQAAINTPIPSTPSGLVVADLNQDGNLDIATSTNGNLTLLLGNGNGTFQVQQPLSLTAVPLAAGDLNGDGKPDLVAAKFAFGTPIETLLNNGDGTFTIVQSLFVVGSGGGSVALSDLNGDQKLDLVMAQSGEIEVPSTVSVLHGNGDGSFANFPSYGTAPGSIAAADFNGDGKIDLGLGVRTLTKTGNGFFLWTPRQ